MKKEDDINNDNKDDKKTKKNMRGKTITITILIIKTQPAKIIRTRTLRTNSISSNNNDIINKCKTCNFRLKYILFVRSIVEIGCRDLGF